MSNNAQEILCDWCIQTDFRCRGVADCDFKKVPKQKEAIIKKITVEAKRYKVAKEKLNSGGTRLNAREAERLVRLSMDLLFGITKMSEALQKEFKMTDEEVRKITGFKEATAIEKMKMAMTMKFLQRKVKN